MREGEVVRVFEAKDGRKVILRAPRWGDLDDMVVFINSLVDEGAEISRDHKVSRGEEVDYLARYLSAVEKDSKVGVVAEVDGHFVGQVEVDAKSGRSRHVGVLGIGLRDGYRDVGIGTELMLEAERQARRLGMKILQLEVYSTNSRARHVYQKTGYIEAGTLRNDIIKDGMYVDSIVMRKEISG